MSARIDLTGHRYGLLTVLHAAGKSDSGRLLWACKCDCGNEKIVSGNDLRMGKTVSCRCVQKEAVRRRMQTHGGSTTSEFSVWRAMWKRCTNPRQKGYALYKDRTPPENWRDFAQFMRDMGPRPSPQHSIERRDNAKPYGTDNCYWATAKEQARNTAQNVWVEVDGVRMLQTDAAKKLGVSPGTIHRRLKVWGTTQKGGTHG